MQQLPLRNAIVPGPGWSENYAQRRSSLTKQKDWVISAKMHGSNNLGMSDGLRAADCLSELSYLNLEWATENRDAIWCNGSEIFICVNFTMK